MESVLVENWVRDPRERGNFTTTFDVKQMVNIESAFNRAAADDPILILNWNPAWLAIPANTAGIYFSLLFSVVDIVTSFCSSNSGDQSPQQQWRNRHSRLRVYLSFPVLRVFTTMQKILARCYPSCFPHLFNNYKAVEFKHSSANSNGGSLDCLQNIRVITRNRLHARRQIFFINSMLPFGLFHFLHVNSSFFGQFFQIVLFSWFYVINLNKHYCNPRGSATPCTLSWSEIRTM